MTIGLDKLSSYMKENPEASGYAVNTFRINKHWDRGEFGQKFNPSLTQDDIESIEKGESSTIYDDSLALSELLDVIGEQVETLLGKINRFKIHPPLKIKSGEFPHYSPVALSETVMHFRKLYCSSQKEFTDKHNLGRHIMLNLEKVKRTPTMTTLYTFCRCVKLKLSDFFLHYESLL